MDEDIYLSKKQKRFGNRSLVREKVLQVLVAYEITNESVDSLFNHIFFREFRFDPQESSVKKLLTQEEIYELEADIPIEWDTLDIQFGEKLVRKTIENKPFAEEVMKQNIENWEFERVTLVDKIILEIAIAELLCFEEIPPKVTINEAIEIAKKYSTEKSSQFVNGVLDKIHKDFIQQGLLHKAGKGLVDE